MNSRDKFSGREFPYEITDRDTHITLCSFYSKKFTWSRGRKQINKVSFGPREEKGRHEGLCSVEQSSPSGWRLARTRDHHEEKRRIMSTWSFFLFLVCNSHHHHRSLSLLLRIGMKGSPNHAIIRVRHKFADLENQERVSQEESNFRSWFSIISSLLSLLFIHFGWS